MPKPLVTALPDGADQIVAARPFAGFYVGVFPCESREEASIRSIQHRYGGIIEIPCLTAIGQERTYRSFIQFHFDGWADARVEYMS